MSFFIRPIQREDQPEIAGLLSERWGSVMIISRGQVHQGDELPGFVAIPIGSQEDHILLGLLTYHVINHECEIVSLDSLKERAGIGSALISAVLQMAKKAQCRRVWLITTNDNLPALHFYQRRGFHLVAVHPGAIDNSRRLKPQIPLTGLDGIPIRDEIELEFPISPGNNNSQ